MIEFLRNLWPFGRKPDTHKVRTEAVRENFHRSVRDNCSATQQLIGTRTEIRRQADLQRRGA